MLSLILHQPVTTNYENDALRLLASACRYGYSLCESAWPCPEAQAAISSNCHLTNFSRKSLILLQ